jgi:16S rRNA (adenine1518-N6/adenine1519-N6)-dimethyltransferase
VYAGVTPLFDVGPGQFHPPPKVDSSVLRIDFMQELLPDIPSFSFFRRLVNTAFQQRRKTLRNSLKALVGKNGAILETAFSSIGVEPNRRPETLSPDEFLKLGEILERHLSNRTQESTG